jgi:hypothetical protein
LLCQIAAADGMLITLLGEEPFFGVALSTERLESH